MENVLDVFNGDPFSVMALTDAINHEPHVPGIAGRVIDWQESGVPTTSIMLEEKTGVLRLVDPTPRGAPGTPSAKPKRTARAVAIPHYEVPGAVMADEVQGVRAWGSGSMVETVQSKVQSVLREAVQMSLDPTLEHQRVGAVKGLITDGSGDTVLDLFDAFGVSQETERNLEANVDNSATGALVKEINAIQRLIAKHLGGAAYSRIVALCGDALYDDLITNKEVVQTYLNWQAAEGYRVGANAGMPFEAFPFRGITWINYRGEVGGTAFVHTDKAHIFPVGVPGLWRTYYAPADYVETVNTPGLPRYARQYAMANGKGVHLDVQMNALNLCTRPKVLIQARRT